MKNDVNRIILRTFGTFIGQISQNLSTRLIQYFESFGTFRTVLVCIFKNPIFSTLIWSKIPHSKYQISTNINIQQKIGALSLSPTIDTLSVLAIEFQLAFRKIPSIQIQFVPKYLISDFINLIICALLGRFKKIQTLFHTKNSSS